MMGPNTVNGHLSVIYSTECQINFTLRLLDPILNSLHPGWSRYLPTPLKRAADTVEVFQHAETVENTWIQRRAKELVWSSGCTNWYIEPKTGKNLMVYPHWQWHYYLRSIFIKRSDFLYLSPEHEPILGFVSLWWSLMCMAIYLLNKVLPANVLSTI